jgi:hypothetical protein
LTIDDILPGRSRHGAYLGCNIVVVFLGKDSGIPAFARGDTDNLTEERIVHILSEASQMMKTQVDDSHSDGSKSPSQGQVRYTSHTVLTLRADKVAREQWILVMLIVQTGSRAF